MWGGHDKSRDGWIGFELPIELLEAERRWHRLREVLERAGYKPLSERPWDNLWE
jgi:hypothetical protein